MGNKLDRCCGRDKLLRQSINEHEINLLLASTDMDREQIINFHVNFLQDCPSGVITKKEFTRMFKELHSNDAKKKKADKFAEYVFKSLVSDSSDTIQFIDFVVCFSITSFGNMREKIQLAFRIYDLNKDNVLEKREMLKVLEALISMTGYTAEMNNKSPKELVESVMKKMDKNGDSVLQLDEFLDGCMEDELIRKILVDPMFNC